MKPIKNWFTLGVLMAMTGLGTAMFVAGLYMETYESPQVLYYNRGLALFEKARQDPKVLDEAVLDFDKSLDDYRDRENPGYLRSLIYPPRSSEIAALALSKKAVLLLYKQKLEESVKAFKDSIAINSGSLPAELIALSMPDERLSAEDIARLADQAYVAIHNLEMLYRKSPSLEEGAGKKHGKGEGYDPEPAPDQKPSPGAGKGGDPNAI